VECTTDADCEAGEVCTGGVCVPDVECTTDADCEAGEFCVGGVCMAGGDNSCVGLCGGQAPGGCYCDEACFGYGDCCEDVCTACPTLPECCTPDCTGKICGDDGCGGSCGTCDPGFKCEDFECVVCEPDCTGGKICGPDGCGGSCGECPEGESCNLAGTECQECEGCAPWQACDGAGGCVDPAGVGECEYGGQWIAEGCFGIDWIGCCAGTVLYYCDDQSGACPLGAACLVALDCGATGAGCGWQEQFFMCVEGEGQPSPDGFLYCDHYECTPQCEGKDCGPDGCGDECGTCGEGEACSEAGVCVVATCEGICGEQSAAGCWCDTTCEQWDDCCEDRCEFCPDVCGGDPCEATCAGVECGTMDACDCGACAAGFTCTENVCVEDVPCVPACEGVVCGDDGCGGSCGACEAGTVCEAGACVEEIVEPECTTDEDCADGKKCNANGECEETGGGGGGDDEGGGGTCATGDSVPTAGLVILFGLLGMAVLRRRATA